MDHDENFQSADEITEFSGLSRGRLPNESLEFNDSSQLDHCEYLNSKNRESDSHEQNTCTDIIKPHSEPDLCTKTLLVDYDVGHSNKHLFTRENQEDKLCVMPGNSKTNANSPNTSKFTEYDLDNEFINKVENKQDMSHNTRKYFFDLSEDTVPCNRTVIPNQNIIKSYINNAPSNSKTPIIKSISKTDSQYCYSLDPEDSFLTLEKQINELPSTSTDWQSNINLKILENNKKQTPHKNIDFNVLETKESNEISEQIIKKIHSNVDTISMENKLTTPRIENPDSLKSYGISNQNITKYHPEISKISMECEQTTPNIKSGSSIVPFILAQDVKDIIHNNDRFPETDYEIEQLFSSISNSESSYACEDTLEYLEHILNYKPKKKGIDKVQIPNETLYQDSHSMREPISETQFKFTENHSNKQYYNPSLDAHSEDSKSKISNLNTVKSSESEDVSPYHNPVCTDNDSPITESQVKALCDIPGNLKSNEIFNKNIAKYHSDFDKTTIECKQIIPNIKTGLSIASDAVSQDISDTIHKDDSFSSTDNEIEQLFGSPSSSESSDACDNTLEYIEHMLNYKPKNKGTDKLQKLNEILHQERLAMRDPINETEFISTENYSTKQYNNPSLDKHSEESKSKISNINTVKSSESEDVAQYHDPVHRDNYFPTTQNQVKELSAPPGDLKSYEIFNHNVAKYNFDLGKTSMECEQIIPNIKIDLSVASDTVSPINYKPKNKGHNKQIQDNNIDLDSLETTDTVGGTHLNKQYDTNLYKQNINNFNSPSCLSTQTMSTDCEADLEDNIFLSLEDQFEKVSVSQGNPELNDMLNQNNKQHNRYFAKPLLKSLPSTPNVKISSPYVVKKSPAISVKETPSKSHKYHYIKSPVAAYIHNSPQVPLVKDVYPRKPLPSTSGLLKHVTVSKSIKSSNKENINLPLVAYKSAKETKLIEIPDKNKFPKCLWAKQMTSSPQPVVIKHEHREFQSQDVPPMSQHGESFGNLPLHQADLSVCTQKIAFRDKNN